MSSLKYINELGKIDKDSLMLIGKEVYTRYNTSILNSTLEKNIEPIFSKIKFLYNNLTIDYREFCNNIISSFYQNEIVIKSQFINQVIMRSRNHVTIFELNSDTSRIDLCKVNGESFAYEIKTDFDNTNRLDRQLDDYIHIFDKTYIITTEKHYKKIKNVIPESCGIYLYRINEKHEIVFHVKKKSRKSTVISAEKQLRILTKAELLKFFPDCFSKEKEDIISNIVMTYGQRKINYVFKLALKSKYSDNWHFLTSNIDSINEIDYQWFFQNNINPSLIYSTKE